MRERLLEKYSEERLPRYTSYPTAPNFSDKIDATTYREWLSNIPVKTPVSLYIHIPFCSSMCWYCGCHTKVSFRDAPVVDYLSALHQEIEITSKAINQAIQARHIHFGGGTPTIIGPAKFFELMKHLEKNFQINDLTETAIEIDPRTLTSEMCDALGEAGVSRASLGVQSFDPKVQEAINRTQTIQQTEIAVSELHKSGIGGINFDLIYGLPHQTGESCIQTTQRALEMQPDRFSVFGYAHIPTFKKHQRIFDEHTLPDGKERHEQAEAISETLVAAGYRRIGLDHFALPGDSLSIAHEKGQLHRNFQGYTTDTSETLIGLGASSIGRVGDGYVQNEVALGRYKSAVSSSNLATAKGYQMTADDQLRATIIENLMCYFEADVGQICALHGVDSGLLLQGNERLNELVEDRLVDVRDGKLIVDKNMRFIIRHVAACFDIYLERGGRTHSKAA